MTRSLLRLLALALVFTLAVPDATAQRQRADRTPTDIALHIHVVEITYDDPDAAQQGDPSPGTITVQSSGAPPDELWNPSSIYLSSTSDPMEGSLYGLTRDENGLLSADGMMPGPMEIGSVGLDSGFLTISFEVNSQAGGFGDASSSGGMGVKSDEQKTAKEQRKQDRHDARMERKAVRTARLAARGHVESVTVEIGLGPPRFKINVSRYPPTMPTGPPDEADQYMGGAVSVMVQ